MRPAQLRVPERERRVVEDRRQRLLQLRAPQLDRRRVGRSCDDTQHGLVELDAARCLWARRDDPFDLEHRLGHERCGSVVVDDDLGQPRPVAQDEERDAA